MFKPNGSRHDFINNYNRHNEMTSYIALCVKWIKYV